MKKLLTLFLFATLLLTACANPNPPIDNGTTEPTETTVATTGAFCMVYEYPVYKTQSKETAYLSILVCVLNPDFQR